MSWLSSLFGVDQANAAAADAATAQLQALNQKQLQEGVMSQSNYDQAQKDIATQDSNANNDAAIGDAFVQGAQEGLNAELALPGKVVGAVGSGAGSLLGGILKNIPWWAWLVGAGALFVWMGGLELLEGSLARRKK